MEFQGTQIAVNGKRYPVGQIPSLTIQDVVPQTVRVLGQPDPGDVIAIDDDGRLVWTPFEDLNGGGGAIGDTGGVARLTVVEAPKPGNGWQSVPISTASATVAGITVVSGDSEMEFIAGTYFWQCAVSASFGSSGVTSFRILKNGTDVLKTASLSGGNFLSVEDPGFAISVPEDSILELQFNISNSETNYPGFAFDVFKMA